MKVYQNYLNMKIREFNSEDIHNGLLDVLKETWFITEISDETLTQWLMSSNYMFVAEFDNKVRVGLDERSYVVDENTKKYTPILAGAQEYTTYGGVAAINALEFSGAPGYDYKLKFVSTGIDD